MMIRKNPLHKKQTGDTASRILLSLAVPAFLLCTVFVGMHGAAPLEKAALFSASLALPQGTAEVIKNDFARAAQAVALRKAQPCPCRLKTAYSLLPRKRPLPKRTRPQTFLK